MFAALDVECVTHNLCEYSNAIQQAVGISSSPSSDWSPPRAYPPPVPLPIGPRPGHTLLLSLLRLVPAPGISSCPSSDWSPSWVYPPVPPPIGPHPGYTL
eukprot:8206172-Pyramimonas_sp.AAC.1